VTDPHSNAPGEGVPPRLHVIPATGCDKALVLRRGPSGQVASLLWNRRDGTLALGQWLKGRIYEHRSDLSPDGRHMIVFAGKGGRFWTALSRAPWLTALHWEPQGSTWFGGGAFTRQGRVFFNGGQPPARLPDRLRPARPDAYPHGADGFHMGGLYPAMMVARGWRIVAGSGTDTVLEKPVARGWRLRLCFEVLAPGRAILSNRYTLLGKAEEIVTDWEWADPWTDGLHLARAGGLLFAPLGPDGPGEMRLIHDLSPFRFEPRIAPYRGVRA
jgi:hypothetical protein